MIHDILIAGGGPGGSTLAALLKKHTNLDVVLVEAEKFPREHIGESFTQRATAVLAESGALEKILASDVWVKKFGGYYAWGDGPPSVSLFEHKDWERDGILRWSFHADRPRMDAILLEHARSCGATVYEGVAIKHVDLGDPTHRVHLEDGRILECRYFVDATGRITDLASRQRKRFLSKYRNIAAWTHVVGARPAQEAAGDWNLFAKLGGVSCIGSYAFEDGWFWYIPVPKRIDGQLVVTHSLGVVTDPRVFKGSGKDYTNVETLLATARRVPILGDLVKDARSISGCTNTATNYSMIADRFCSYDERWVSIGDAAYFVDPLFSSGVAFALNHAASAALLLEVAFSDRSARDKRDLFCDYDEGWRSLACSFAIILDQWYHAIAQTNPASIYWDSRTSESLVDIRVPTFNALVDTAISPDLLMVITKGQGKISEMNDGPLLEALKRSAPEPDAGDRVVLRDGVSVRPSLSLEVGLSKINLARLGSAERLRAYWDDPVRNREGVPRLYDAPLAYERFERGDGGFSVRNGGADLAARLRAPVRYGEIRASLTEEQRLAVRKLRGHDMLVVGS